jgi:hypothetical protein
MVLIAENISGNSTAWWQPEPTSRGTFSIISSCIITTSLCVWRAVHLNIPGPNEKNRKIFAKLTWLLLGLFAPEVVVFAAWYQRRMAKDLSAKLEYRRTMRGSEVSQVLRSAYVRITVS